MKPSRLVLVIVCLCMLGGVIAYRASRTPVVASPSPAAPVLPETGAKTSPEAPASFASSAPSVVPVATAVPETPAADAPATEAAPTANAEQSIARIEAAVVTYEPASLSVIAPYLTHSDPELRLAAREGMLQMGLTEAVPLLREAAGKMKDPREAMLLLDAADFLELPSMPVTGNSRRVTRSAHEANAASGDGRGR